MNTLKKFKQLLTLRFTMWSIVVAVGVFTFIIWSQNSALVYFIVFESGVPLVTKFSLLGYLYLGIGTNFTTTSAIATSLIVLLSGINAGLLAEYLHKTKSIRSLPANTTAVQIGALFSAIFGIGCASCGSIILMAILLQFGAGGMLFLLPWHGEEFAFLAVGLLLYSVVLLWRKMQVPLVCD